MKKIAVFTTIDDISLPLFFDSNFKKLFEVKAFIYNNIDINSVNPSEFDEVYFRDPFNSILSIAEIDSTINSLLEIFKNTNKLDNISTLDDIYIEDKWKQYQLFREIMPQTKLLENLENINFDKYFYKKRISSRAKGIYFNINEIIKNTNGTNEIVFQEKLNIIEEYRVVVVRDQIIKKAVIKSSKTSTNKVKITSTSEITAEINSICEYVMSRVDLDFYGLDIAKIDSNEYKLIEVNRSPQFLSFYKFTNINPLLEL